MNTYYAPGSAPGTPSKNFSDILSHTFSIFGAGIGWFLIASVAIFMINGLQYLLSDLILGSNQMAAINTTTGTPDIEQIKEIYMQQLTSGQNALQLLLSLIFSLLLFPMYAGIIKIADKVSRGVPVQLEDVFVGYRENLVQYMVLGLLYSIAMFVGALFCGVGIFFVLPLVFLSFPILLFEKGTAMEAMKKSFAYGKANYGLLLGVSIIAFLISVAGVLLCCVGVVGTMPIYYIASFSAYLAIKNNYFG